MSIMLDGEALIKRTSITELVGAYRQSTAEITEAYRLLVQAESRLNEFFGSDCHFHLERGGGRYNAQPDYEHPEATIGALKREVWGVLIQRLELKRVLSIEAANELDRQIETGEGLPEINEEGVQGLLKGTMEQIPRFIEAAIKEVHKLLTPSGGRMAEYVTNSAFKIGKRVVIGYAVERRWSGPGFHVRHAEDKLRAIDRVFHALDGNGAASQSYGGELCNSIESTQGGEGETQYFKWRAFLNGNLHLEFKRQDLLDDLNAVASGNALDWQKGKRGQKAREQQA